MKPENIQLEAVGELLITHATQWGLKIIAAIAVWFIGRWLIKLISNIFQKVLDSGQKIDTTLILYMRSIISWLLTLMLLLAILGIFGIQTTSFAALLAGVGLAVGTAWGGLLSHFAAGVFIQLMRPFKVGDTITLSSVNGTVADIGVFTTTIIASGNIKTIIPNSKILSDNIQNYSALPYRRVDSNITLPYSTDIQAAMERLKQQLPQITNVRSNPPPSVSISEFTTDGIRLTASTFAVPEHVSQIQADMNQTILGLLSAIGTPRSELHIVNHTPAS